jgi:hypothetical protein
LLEATHAEEQESRPTSNLFSTWGLWDECNHRGYCTKYAGCFCSQDISPEIIAKQIEAIFEDIRVERAKDRDGIRK